MNRILLMLIISFSFIKAGYTQNTLTGQNALITENAASNNTRSKLSTPFGVSSLPNLYSNVSVSSFLKEGVNGKIELQAKFNSRWSGGLTIDQKISKGSSQATPLDLSGISPGTTVKFNLQKMFWHPHFVLADGQIANLDKVNTAYADRKKIPPRTAGLRDISIDGTEDEKKQALAALSSVSYKEPLFINVELGFTKTSFLYATDSFTLKENKDVFITPTFTFSIVKALGSGFNVTGYAAISYNYTESYNAADALDFNIPFGSSRNSYTSTLAFGRPDKKVSHNVMGEFRQNILKQNNATIAISPSVTLGINSKKLSIFIPVYFIKGLDENGKITDGLQGGIRFGYITSTERGKVSSFKNGFIAQLIISKPLDFLEKF